MAHHSYRPSSLSAGRRPTSWLAASHLPITPPASCSDATAPLGPAYRQHGRPDLSLDCGASISDVISTPALSNGSSASSSSSSFGGSSGSRSGEAPPHWQYTSSPEVHAGLAGRSPPGSLRGRDLDLQHQLALRNFEQKQAAARVEELPCHPRIVKAPSDRKPGFVEGLVDTAEIAITSIWATSAESGAAPTSESVLPLRWFVKETLRRSRTSCSTLQLALFYLHRGRMRIRERVVRAENAKAAFARLAAASAYPSPPASPPHDSFLSGADAQVAAEVLASSRDPIVCGRRMFLAALVCASKFLQDRNYSTRAWSKISGLSVQEINANERALLNLLEYQLFVPPEVFANWTTRLEKLATDHARQSRSSSMDEPMSPVSPLSPSPSSPSLSISMPASLPRSLSEYVPAPTLGSDVHANLPTPILGAMAPPPPHHHALRRADSDRFDTKSTSARRRPSMAMSVSSRSCNSDAVAGWLATQQHGADAMVH